MLSIMLCGLIVTPTADAKAPDRNSAAYQEALSVAKAKPSEFKRKSFRLFEEKKFDTIEIMLQLVRDKYSYDPPHVTKVTYFYNEIQNQLEKNDKLNSLVEDWAKSNPKSTTALLFKSYRFRDKAWKIRGRGYASQLSEEQIKGFRENLTRAQEYVEKAEELGKTVSADYGSIYIAKLGLLTGLGGDRDTVIKILKNGAKKAPRSLSMYQSAANLLLPRWFGKNANDWEIAADLMVENTKKDFGQMDYARIVNHLTLLYKDVNFMRARKVNYTRLKQGYEDWLKHNPHSTYAWNFYCLFAIQEADRLAVRRALSLRRASIDLLPKFWRYAHERDIEQDIAEWKEWAAKENPAPKRQELLFGTRRANFDAVCFSHDGKFLFLGARQGGVIKVDYKEKKANDLIEGDERVIDLYSWPNAPLIVIVGEKAGGRADGRANKNPYCRIVNYNTKKEVAKIDLVRGLNRIGIDPEGKFLVTSNLKEESDIVLAWFNEKKGTIKIEERKLEDRGEIGKSTLYGAAVLRENKGGKVQLLFSANKGVFVSPLSKEKPQFWNSGKKFEFKFDPVFRSIVVSPDVVFTVGMFGVTPWDRESKSVKVKPLVKAHLGYVRKPVFSKKANVFATCAWGNGTVRLWDGKSGECVSVIRFPAYAFSNAVAISPDGKTLIHCQNNHNTSMVMAIDLSYLTKEKK